MSMKLRLLVRAILVKISSFEYHNDVSIVKK